MARQSPAALDRLGEEDPGSLGERGIVGGRTDQAGELAHHGQLLLAVEGTRIGEHLDAHVVPVSVHIGERALRQVVDEGGGVLAEQGDVGHPLNDHQGVSQLSGQLATLGKGARGGVDVDHGHVGSLSMYEDRHNLPDAMMLCII